MKTRLILMPLVFVAAGLTVGCEDSLSPPAAGSAAKQAPQDDHAVHDHKDGDHDGHDHSKTTAPATQPAQ